MNIRHLKLTKEIIDAIKQEFNWAFFTEGEAKMTVTKHGGISAFGEQMMTKAISWEVLRKRTYWLISLLEYPKGCVIHFHIMNTHIPKITEQERIEVVTSLYNQVFSACERVSNVILERSST